MEKHIHLLGLLFVIYGAMGVVGAIVVFGILLLTGAIAGAAADEAGVMALTTILGLSIGLIALITNLPSIFAGWGLMKRKSWSRIVGLIVGILCLLAVPFGTALGIYALWVLMKDEATEMLGGTA